MEAVEEAGIVFISPDLTPSFTTGAATGTTGSETAFESFAS